MQQQLIEKIRVDPGSVLNNNVFREDSLPKQTSQAHRNLCDISLFNERFEINV